MRGIKSGFTLISLLAKARSCKGFTLIELMVVIAIIAILVVVAIPSYNEYNNNQKLAEAANNLQAVLRQAQNNAQTGTGCKSGATVYTSTKWTVSLIHADPVNSDHDSYQVFPKCDFSTFPAGTLTPTPSSQTYQFPSGITFISVINSGDCGISFSDTPTAEPGIIYNNLSSEPMFDLTKTCPLLVNDFVKIKLSLNNSGTNTRTIMVGQGGGIYVEGQ